MSLTLVIGNKNFSSWSLRAWLTIELTGAAYDEQLVSLYGADSRRQLLLHSPTGKVPVLKCDDGAIWDSLAIAEYLAERFPEAHLWPLGQAAR
ncbi:MAG: glutathione S-transferase N-terminal domain-containing protein, partial [Pseudomonas sp.]